MSYNSISIYTHELQGSDKGEVIRRARKNKFLSQQQLAKEMSNNICNDSSQANAISKRISKWETGETQSINATYREALFKTLDITEDDFKVTRVQTNCDEDYLESVDMYGALHLLDFIITQIKAKPSYDLVRVKSRMDKDDYEAIKNNLREYLYQYTKMLEKELSR